MRDVGGGHGNGLLQKIILGIAATLCVMLIGVIVSQIHDQNQWMQQKAKDDKETAERLARLETKVDMLLRASETR